MIQIVEDIVKQNPNRPRSPIHGQSESPSARLITLYKQRNADTSGGRDS